MFWRFVVCVFFLGVMFVFIMFVVGVLISVFCNVDLILFK